MTSFSIAFKHIRRSPYQALAAVSIIFLTFFVASLVFIIGNASSALLKYFESRPQIAAYLKEDKEAQKIDDIKSKLEATGKVSSIRYITKEEALQIYKEQNKNDPILLEMVTADILPASLEVSAKDVKDLNALASILEKEEIIDSVVYQKDVVENLITWTNAIRMIGLVISTFLTLVSLLILLTITGMRIALKKEEIEILRLVGASAWYIKFPFILEGIIYGLISGVLAWVTTYLLILYATPFLSSFLAGLPVKLPPPFTFMFLYLLGISFGAGLLGAFGSYVSVKRYLK